MKWEETTSFFSPIQHQEFQLYQENGTGFVIFETTQINQTPHFRTISWQDTNFTLLTVKDRLIHRHDKVIQREFQVGSVDSIFSDFEELIQLCGGEIVSKDVSSKSLEEWIAKRLIVLGDPHSSLVGSLPSDKKVVDLQWVMDSLSKGELQSFSGYIK